MAANYSDRMERILKIVSEIKCRPHQTVHELISLLGVSRAQFYDDREELAKIGFCFRYDRKGRRFVIERDRYLPVENLTLSETLALILAVRHLCTGGDYVLGRHSLDAARKLIGGLEGNSREAMTAILEGIIFKEGFGCDPKVLEKLQSALAENRRVLVVYRKPSSLGPEEYELDPYHLYFKRHALYLEAYSVTRRAMRNYRVGRIEEVRPTPMHFRRQEGYDFSSRHRWTFSAFAGEDPQTVTVRFSRRVRSYIEEVLWHDSQEIVSAGDGGILFKVAVAEPREVLWWVLGWGADAEIVGPEWLRDEAKKETERMYSRYRDDNR